MKNIDIIGAPSKYGCPVAGADLAFESLKNSLEMVFEVKCNKQISIGNMETNCLSHDNIKNIDQVMEFNKKLHSAIVDSLKSQKFPLIVGGDHSIAIGSISAALDFYKGNVSVIYVDKHADIHNEKTTPSGNIHGMPLSICIGRCDNRFNIGTFKLNPKNLFYLGLCNYEQEEIDYINKENIFYLKDTQISENNIEEIVKALKRKINTKNIHLSFDLDSIMDKDFHAVNVSVNNEYQDHKGMSLSTVKEMLLRLLESFNITSMDIVEYNPLLDTSNICKEKIESLLCIIKECISNKK